jgi:hypothetical protein
VALIELVANSWDAGATRVEIVWPDDERRLPFSIMDNGHGMSDGQFKRRWFTLSYDRRNEQGSIVYVPEDLGEVPPREAFGQNGIGRHGAFAFGASYLVHTWRDGTKYEYRVTRGTTRPLALEELGSTSEAGHGTVIGAEVSTARFPSHSPATVRSEISLRFLVDPSFEVFVDGQKVTLTDVPAPLIDHVQFDVDGVGPVTISVLDTRETDRTTRFHGIAWQVRKRLVGRCSWVGSGHERFLDGRRAEAKRYTFLVSADGLHHSGAVKQDWSGFRAQNDAFVRTNEAVQEFVRHRLLELTREKRDATTQALVAAHRKTLSVMSPASVEKWFDFVEEAQTACPGISEKELVQLAGVLANLELSKSKYRLLDELGKLGAEDFDKLHSILSEWTLDTAKLVLDELQGRIKLVDELTTKVASNATDEVQELQPLFKRGLWIFGPEYETIEYTSNEGMTKVIQRLFNVKGRGTLLRPDFAILPDGTAGFYSYPKYDAGGGEIGVDALSIVELKKPGVPISTEQKSQAWKYVKELMDKGLVQSYTRVTCFVLGSEVDPSEAGEDTKNNGAVRILPLNYNTVLIRAKSRLLKLYDRVRHAPFLNQEVIEDFLHPLPVEDGEQGRLAV